MMDDYRSIGDWRKNLEYVIKNSVVTGNPHKAEKLTTWAYQAFQNNAERVAKRLITFDEGWKNHKAICHECTEFGIKRGEEFEQKEYGILVHSATKDIMGTDNI